MSKKVRGILSILLVIAITLSLLVIPSTTAKAADNNSPGIIGWDGDKDAVIVNYDGSFYVKDGKNTSYGFGIYNNPGSVKWYMDGGYLPCLITEFTRNNCTVRIANFCDLVNIGGNNYSVVYSSVFVKNNGTTSATLDPAPSAGMVALTNNSTTVAPGQEVEHDYAVAADRFGASYAWPSDSSLAGAGTRQSHWTHMRDYWNNKLSGIVTITQLPDARLIDSLKAGYIYTMIIRDGNDLCTGENMWYDMVWDHDAIGILSTLFTLGDFNNATGYLSSIQASLQYSDAKWKFSWPYALYLQKTGDQTFVSNNFNSIKTNTHYIESDRTGPDGIMKSTNDIDSNGYWTIDNCSALFGLTTYKYIADTLGNTTESSWANNLYNSLLTSVNNKLTQTMTNYNLDYIPVSMVEPNTSNRCNEPRDANWASTFLFGRWHWDGLLFNANQNGVLLDKVANTYDYGFSRSAGILPQHDFGGYPHGFYSSAYNAGYGSAGLRTNGAYRSEGIKAYQFMLDNTQNSPNGWWEGIWYPTVQAWEGTHPYGGAGSSPHMWGQSVASKVLVDSLIAEKSDGVVLVGRGVPNEWVQNGKVIELSNYPIKNNGRMGIKIEGLANNQVKLTLSGTQARNNVVFNLPIFQNNIVSTTSGTINNADGSVTIPATTTSVTVTYGNVTTAAEPVTSGSVYRLVNKHSGKVLDVADGSVADGGNVQQYIWNGTPAQKWSIVKTVNGYYKLVSQRSNRVLDVQNGSTADGANVQQWTDNGTAAQQWSITPTGGGYYKLINKGSGKALDVEGQSLSDGANVHQWTYGGYDSQLWTIEPVTEGNIISGAAYKITNRNSGKVLDITGGSQADGAKAQQWYYNGSPAQEWQIVNLGNGNYKLICDYSGKALDVEGQSLSNGALIHQWAYGGYSSQQWQLNYLGNGYFSIINSGSGKALDVQGQSLSDGGAVNQWTYGGWASQQWKIEIR